MFRLLIRTSNLHSCALRYVLKILQFRVFVWLIARLVHNLSVIYEANLHLEHVEMVLDSPITIAYIQTWPELIVMKSYKSRKSRSIVSPPPTPTPPSFQKGGEELNGFQNCQQWEVSMLHINGWVIDQ